MRTFVIVGFVVGAVPFAAVVAYYLVDYRRMGELYRVKLPWMPIAALGFLLAAGAVVVGIVSTGGRGFHLGTRTCPLADRQSSAREQYVDRMDVVSAKVLGTGAFVFGLIFIVTSAVRLSRADLDVVLLILNTALGILLLYAGVRRWRFALRGAKHDR